MKNTIFAIFISALLFGFMSCTNTPKPNADDVTGKVQDVIKHDTDKELSTQIVGAWNAVETVRGEILVFDTSGGYSGYDGRSDFKGTWNIKDQKITLSLGGTYKLKIDKDTMYMDESKYLRENNSLTEK